MSFYANEIEQHGRFARIFAYGQEKSKKTWWACKAAEAGFNVTLLDGDAGALITRNLSAKARERIGIINLVQERTRTVFPEFIAQFLRPENKFVWDLEAKKTNIGLKDPEHSHIIVDASKLTGNDVVIIDSWSALAVDVRQKYANEHNIDLSDAERTDWDGYGFEGNFLTWTVTRLKALNCHVIVIGHETVYEKRDKDGKKILSQTTQPISSSGPHAKTLGKNFDDILYFQRASDTAFFIHTGGEKDRVGGGRLMAPANYKWEDLPPSRYLEATGAKGDFEKQSDAFVYYGPFNFPANINAAPKIGVTQTVAPIHAEQKVVSATPPAGTSISLLSSLGKK